MRVRVVTVSDRASKGEYEDRSGPEIERILRQAYPDASITREVVSDEVEAVRAALDREPGADWTVTCGGTGIGPRDVTPEATRPWIERELPGLAEALRAESLRETPFACLSRGLAGMRGGRFVVNLPGSPAAARLGAAFLVRVMGHAMETAKGGGH